MWRWTAGTVALMFTSTADETAKRESVLVVSAHPDDSIAMAGTMFLMKDKFDIHIADMTKGQARDLSTLGHDGPQAERRMKEEEAAAAEDKWRYVRCHESQNDGDYLLNVEMHGAKGRGYQAMYFGGREFAECFAPLAGFHVQGSRCIFNELSSPKGGER